MPRVPTKTQSGKPAKPYPDFPLTPHPAGHWCKCIRREVRYFGPWGKRVNGKMQILPEGGAWKQALELYLKQRDDLYAGRKPSTDADGKLTVKTLCNKFLNAKREKLATGELVERTWEDYRKVCVKIIKVFGKNRLVEDLKPSDFAHLRKVISKSNGLVSISGWITRARVVFNFAHKNDLIERPVRYGTAFDRPSAKSLRQEEAKRGPRMFEAEQCRQLIDNGQSPELKAMILLALNCGFGNSDCAKVPMAAVDFAKGMLTFPRPKTGMERRCPLWPETLTALQAVVNRRRQDRDLLFVTKYGNTYENDPACISKEFRKLLDEAKLHRDGLGFYTLRHVFRTIADETKDTPAVRLIMGHVDGSIDSVYRERISDERLQAVVDHVRSWLFKPDQPTAKPTDQPAVAERYERPQLKIVG